MLLEIIVSLLAVAAARILWKRWKYDLHKIPSPPGWPYLGHLPYIRLGKGRQEFTEFIGRSWRKLSQPKIFRLQVLGKPLLCIRNIECVKTVVLSKTDAFPKNKSIIPLFATLLGGRSDVSALLMSTEVTPYVKRVRKVYLNAMQTSSLRLAIPKLHGTLDRMIEIIESQRQQGPIDFQKLCVRLTLDAIGVAAFGMPLGGMDGDWRIYELLIKAGHIGQRRRRDLIGTALHKMFPTLREAQRQRQVVQELTAEWERLTTDILKRDDPPPGEEPIWHGLRSLINPATNKALDYRSLVAEVATVTLTGMDTTGHQLAYILALLADHPHVVEKLLKELKDKGVDGEGGKDLTLEALVDLPYLFAIVKEGMRVAFVMSGPLDREVPHDMTILGYRVPKGTRVHVPGNRWMSTVSDWGDPESFRPERWLTEEDMSSKYYVGFSFGPRDCVGQRLATTEIRIAVARLMQLYTFTATRSFDEAMADCQNGGAVESVKGIWLHVSPRAALSCA